jgi:peroxiredoxin Q/BCP
MARQLAAGDRAPEFTLRDQTGADWRLTDALARGPVVLFFYPKDDTPVCIVEACAFRDQHQVFAERGAQVVGVSSNDVESHQRFAGRYDLPYTLLSDPEGELRGKFGVKKTLGFFDGRVTFIIGSDGVVAHVHSSALDAKGHVSEALAALERLSSR